MTCKHLNNSVTDSRSPEAYGIKSQEIKDKILIVRRRKCKDCGYRFTTYEVTRESVDIVKTTDGNADVTPLIDNIIYMLGELKKKQVILRSDTEAA